MQSVSSGGPVAPAPLLLALVLSGCGVTDLSDTARYEFLVRELGEPRTTNLADTAEVDGGENSFSVQGTIRVPNPCHSDLEARGGRTGDRITVIIRSVESRGRCERQPAAIDYRAATSEVASGRWRVEVLHREGADQRRVAVDTVTVESQPTTS